MLAPPHRVAPHPTPYPTWILQVFHCVMYPRVNFDLPILSMDIVANQGRVSLAIVDPCPVTPNLELPPFYEQPVRWVGPARPGSALPRVPPCWAWRAAWQPARALHR